MRYMAGQAAWTRLWLHHDQDDFPELVNEVLRLYGTGRVVVPLSRPSD